MINSWRAGLAVLACSLALCSVAAAEEHMLARTELRLSQGTAAAELWGERLAGGYVRRLLVLVRGKDQRLVTAYRPSVRGGYNPLLQAVQVKPAADSQNKSSASCQQLLLSVGQGDWDAPAEYRVLDFSRPAQVRELFDAADSMGLVSRAVVKEGLLELALADGQQKAVPLPAGTKGTGRVEYGGLHSLTPHDVDGDGQQELLSCQQLVLAGQQLADVGAVWRWQQPDAEGAEAVWRRDSLTVMTAAPADKHSTVNAGKNFSAGVILPRRLAVPGGEAAYPVFACGDAELQNKLNALLAEECEPYLRSFYEGAADMAFKVVRADAGLLTIQIISGRESFISHYINIDPAAGERLRLEQLLDTEQEDLLPLLRLLCTNKNMRLESLPGEWYLDGGNLFLVQRVGGRDETAGFALGNLHKYLQDRKWLGKS